MHGHGANAHLGDAVGDAVNGAALLEQAARVGHVAGLRGGLRLDVGFQSAQSAFVRFSGLVDDYGKRLAGADHGRGAEGGVHLVGRGVEKTVDQAHALAGVSTRTGRITERFRVRVLGC